MDGRDFVPLAALLTAPPTEPDRIPQAPAARETADVPEHEACASCGAVRDALLFRAALADALDDAVARMLRDVAADVLARELRLAPCDIAAIVTRVRAQTPVVRVRVAPDDDACRADLPVVVDAALAAGDAVVELDGGEVDARLGVRLACVLEACA